jgi:CHAT domain-containing protein
MRGFGRYFPRLPFSILEVKAVSQLVPPEDLLVSTGFTATKARLLRSDISDYRILHLSTHALLDETDPELSGVVLSQVDRDGKPQDGFLHLYEIYNLQLANTDLAVLSACNTGLGKETRGEGVVGIARGFLSAGAQRVLVSLWEVEDDATAELMQRFYQALLGKRCLPPDGALAAAQRSMMADRRWQDPYYWAAFELVASRD